MTLFVINPNSTQAVTDGIDAAISPLRQWGQKIECLTLADGPPGIETDQHVVDVVAPTLALVETLKPRATGFVIACFSDPGVAALRKITPLPVLGIREAAITQALTLGHRFGIIAIGEASIPRHLAAVEAIGVTARLAGDRALGLSVVDLSDATKTEARLTHIAKTLRDTDKADVLILGCAGMAQYRATLEASVGIPVIDPCQAAVALALGRITLDQTHQPEIAHA